MMMTWRTNDEQQRQVRAGGPAAAKLTARSYRAGFAPTAYGPDDVKRVRDVLGMSQANFAGYLGVDANTVRSWEQGTRPPSTIARRFMGEIESDPAYWRRRVAQTLADASTEGPTDL
jgi:putative transcriptional regulator